MTNFFVIARTINALLSVGICLLIYNIGRKLFDKAIGLTASILVCFSFLIVRDSHYAVNDIPGTFFMVLSFNYIVSICVRERLRDYILSGLFAGMAIAVKYNMGIVIFPLIVAHFYSIHKVAINKNLMWAALTCVVGFLSFCPWALLDHKAFWEHFIEQAKWGNTVWFGGISTIPYVQYIKTLIWGYGFLPLCFFIIGFIILWKKAAKQKVFLLVCFPLIYYLLLGGMKLFFVRFAIPLIPYLCVFSAYGIISVARRASYLPRNGAVVFLVLIVISQGVIFSIRHNYLISKTDTRILARNWIKNNIPDNSKIVMEGYGPSLKVYNDKNRFKENLNGYQVDHIWADLPKKSLEAYREENRKYLITSSYINRRYLSHPEKYPNEIAFYVSLEEEANEIFKILPSKEIVPFYLDEVYSPFWNLFVLEYPGPTISVFQIQD